MNRPGDEVRIRRMTPGDLERVIEIAQDLKDAPHWPRAVYAAALDPEHVPRRIALVAEDAETGAGTGFLVAGMVPPQAELESIAVAAECHRRGIGGRLLAAMVEELRRKLIQEVFLEVRASNRTALAFYRATGFAEAGRRPRYYADPEEDAVLLNLRLE
jgi:ribosomal-protein-alanine acetyltransferase